MSQPSKAELVMLLESAREAIVASQEHWGAVLHLTGDRRLQRRQQGAIALLDAMLQPWNPCPSVSRPFQADPLPSVS
jgi:hypothetical protein